MNRQMNIMHMSINTVYLFWALVRLSKKYIFSFIHPSTRCAGVETPNTGTGSVPRDKIYSYWKGRTDFGIGIKL